MGFDTFISYSSKDKTAADAACAVLEQAGIRCWIAPRDIRPGGEYGGAIIEAIEQCRVMVLIFSSSANSSRQIHREIERAVSKGVPIIPVRIEQVVPTRSMEYFLGAIHWLDALTPPLENHLRRLAETVKTLLQLETTAPSTPPQDNDRQAAALERGQRVGAAMRGNRATVSPVVAQRLLIPAIGVGCIALLIGGIWLYQMHEPLPPKPASSQSAAATIAAAGRQKENVDALYRLILETTNNTIGTSGEIKGQRVDYTGRKNPKALAVCINWSDISATKFSGSTYMRTGSSATPPPSVEAAAAEALQSCQASCKATCVLADRNGQNALQPPADWP
jgi:TIR domain